MRQLPDSPVLPVKPGQCAECQHASVRATNRGTAYLRCTRAEWDDRLVRYPTLPVTGCPGFEPAVDEAADKAAGGETQTPAAGPRVPGPRRGEDRRGG